MCARVSSRQVLVFGIDQARAGCAICSGQMVTVSIILSACSTMQTVSLVLSDNLIDILSTGEATRAPNLAPQTLCDLLTVSILSSCVSMALKTHRNIDEPEYQTNDNLMRVLPSFQRDCEA